MKRAAFALILLCGTLNAWSLGQLANVDILDRDTGETLPVYRHGSDYWVAGHPGSRYAVVITNRRGERLLAVTSVDGINVISGETAAWGQTGYVFEPRQSYGINGWRKSSQEVADFNFSALPDSYAVRSGRAGNCGVIGVALFRERPAPVAQVAPETYDAPGASALPTSPIPPGRYAESLARATDGASNSSGAAEQKLGTGHGAREVSRASDTRFERLSESPDEMIRIRYDRLENLIAMGIVRTRPAPGTPNAFPDSPVARFVPDPPGRM